MHAKNTPAAAIANAALLKAALAHAKAPGQVAAAHSLSTQLYQDHSNLHGGVRLEGRAAAATAAAPADGADVASAALVQARRGSSAAASVASRASSAKSTTGIKQHAAALTCAAYSTVHGGVAPYSYALGTPSPWWR